MTTRPRLRTLVLLVLALLAIGLVTGAYIVTTGVSARPSPSTLEAITARTIRGIAIRTRIRGLTNPVPVSDAVVKEGMEHFADHCASCHGNDGSGDTETGRGLYPRAPDMRLPATQNLSDGELFYIIENGVRLTGMPAWGSGSPESQQSTWKLVRFIRHLPSLTPDERTRMEHLNPKGPEESQTIDPDAFLRGEDPSQPSEKPPAHKHQDKSR